MKLNLTPEVITANSTAVVAARQQDWTFENDVMMAIETLGQAHFTRKDVTAILTTINALPVPYDHAAWHRMGAAIRTVATPVAGARGFWVAKPVVVVSSGEPPVLPHETPVVEEQKEPVVVEQPAPTTKKGSKKSSTKSKSA